MIKNRTTHHLVHKMSLIIYATQNNGSLMTDDTFKMWPEVLLQLQSWISR